MTVDPRAGQPPTQAMLANVPRLVAEYYTRHPDASVRDERVSFGTSGHRGTSLRGSFNEDHIVAIAQAIAEYRRDQGYTGPLFLGIDTHALSEPALSSALEVLAANAVEVMVDSRDGFTPTPAVSHAILRHNRGRTSELADGIVVTPSHNPPEDGGFKYNPPNGGPADTAVTSWIQNRANALLEARLAGVKRVSVARARTASTTHRYDYLDAYVADLGSVIDFDVIRGATISMAVDPLGGAGVSYWGEIAARYRIPLEVLSDTVDPTFRFMSADWDGRIRMDCSSPYAMRKLIDLKDRYDVAWACDTDHDRHGIVARSAGLLNPNHYLAVSIAYLASHRPQWRADVGIGKTVVSSSMIDRVAARLKRRLVEVPVGFKWFVDGLIDGSLGFVGEESAGATLLRRDGAVWTTDKDGIVMGLLAAEMTAAVGRDPGEQYAALTAEFGDPAYARIDAPASRAQKAVLAGLSERDVSATELAGESIVQIMTKTPHLDAPIGGLKVTTENGWFAARPSGTEDVYKLYAESFLGPDHLSRIQAEAQQLVSRAFAAAGAS
ncbi:MAG: alpha-D-glucose phosphate-specific phosphoglucomutase [Gemmatimonadaceae bacterium]|nr:alpha-D-glucose phosphate-specific phosphoglucomutase [Gemmatimonadaceae bacterium]NUR35472.1 alpha-D-glucose phosphate-specific phosphoglucomutase [Gemmatimonadaceae bacterium]NUS48198.1 alpha-D-glucose phosphate-specific phosphoglucomutase [Gemmatimonadaceae bacterium]